jgi:hypothetical protein
MEIGPIDERIRDLCAQAVIAEEYEVEFLLDELRAVSSNVLNLFVTSLREPVD